jgi:hypothetical protein
MSLQSKTRTRPYCWVRGNDRRYLTARQARAIAASEHCTESAYIHPVGDPDTELTSREEIVAHSERR